MGILNRIKSALFDLHPELQYREPILRIEAGGSKPDGGEYIQNSGYFISNIWVQKAVRIWKDNIANKPIKIVEENGDESETLSDHPYETLLANPNPEMSASDLWSTWAVDMALGGEHGLEISRGAIRNNPLEIWATAPSEFDVRPESGVAGSRYRKVAFYRIKPGDGDDYKLEPDEFIHFKFYNPLNIWRGIAPLTAARLGVKLDIYSSRYPLDFYEGGARPDYALMAPEGLTADERAEYKAQLMQEHGAGRRFEPIILESGVTDIKEFNFSLVDLGWLEQKKVSRDEIGAIYGVPDGIMGWGAESYDTATKLDGDVRALWELTLDPIIRFRDDVLTRYGRRNGIITNNQKCMTDLSTVAVLQEDVSGKIEMLNILASRGVPVNMASAFLRLGLDEIPGGDVGYLPFSLVPVEAIETGETLDDPRSDQRESTRALKTKGAPEYGSKQHEVIVKRKAIRIDRFVAEMKRELKKYLQDQQNEISRNLRESKELGRGRYKEPTVPLPPLSSIFDQNKWRLEFIDRFENIVTVTLFAVANDEIDALNALGADLADFEGRPEVLATIREILEEHARKTQNTTFLELTELFESAEREGESIPAIMERLSQFYGDKKSEYQTERIARTTLTATSNAGDVAAWDQSEIVTGKTWISALSSRSRDAHINAHGQTVRINESYDVGGELLRYPGDPQGSAGNVINCLCTQIAEVEF